MIKDSAQSDSQDTTESAGALLEEGMGLAKCVKCGCMKEALESITSSLRSPRMDGHADMREKVSIWLGQIEPAEYS